ARANQLWANPKIGSRWRHRTTWRTCPGTSTRLELVPELAPSAVRVAEPRAGGGCESRRLRAVAEGEPDFRFAARQFRCSGHLSAGSAPAQRDAGVLLGDDPVAARWWSHGPGVGGDARFLLAVMG